MDSAASGAGAPASAPAAAAGPRSRLMILKMVLENFKSYGGVKEIGPFHKSFSSVVGPNGSGKSNVIDAMLFVFGKKASKMRLNKVRHVCTDFIPLCRRRVSSRGAAVGAKSPPTAAHSNPSRNAAHARWVMAWVRVSDRRGSSGPHAMHRFVRACAVARRQHSLRALRALPAMPAGLSPTAWRVILTCLPK
jgi:hypothetical protein